MKTTKITKIGLSFLFMTLVALGTNAFSGNFMNFNLRTAISLPEDLHPDYAPEINVATKGNSDQGIEIIYANAMLQFLAGGLLYLAGPIAIFMIAIAGLRYVTAHGDQNMIDGAKKTLTYAIVGLVIIILSFAIIKGIISAVVSTG